MSEKNCSFVLLFFYKYFFIGIKPVSYTLFSNNFFNKHPCFFTHEGGDPQPKCDMFLCVFKLDAYNLIPCQNNFLVTNKVLVYDPSCPTNQLPGRTRRQNINNRELVDCNWRPMTFYSTTLLMS